MAIQETQTTPTPSWDTLWQFMDALAGATVLDWAERQGFEAFVVPVHPDWPRGLVVFTDRNGVHHGLPLDRQGHVSRAQEVYFAETAWADLGRLCADQSQQWAVLAHHWNMAPTG